VRVPWDDCAPLSHRLHVVGAHGTSPSVKRILLAGGLVAALGVGIYQISAGDEPTAPAEPAGSVPAPVAAPGPTVDEPRLPPPNAETSTSPPAAAAPANTREAETHAAKLRELATEGGQTTPTATPTPAEDKREATIRGLRDQALTEEGPATFSGEEGVAHKKRLGRVVERAACQAPDLDARYTQMPAADAEALRATCAKYGITLRAPKP